MLRNYLTIAFRNLRKNRTYALINVTGLALGMGCALLIFAGVRYHFSTDRHHHNYDRIYRIVTTFTSPEGDFHTPGVPYAFGKAVRNEYPDITRLAMIDVWEQPMVSVPVAKSPDRKFKETERQGAFVEPSYFQIFDYIWLAGSPEGLNQPSTVVVSAAIARKYFGTTTGVLGKLMKLDGRVSARIIGVFQDYRDNTDFAYAIMPSYATLAEFRGESFSDRFSNISSSSQCFVLLNDPFTATHWAQQMTAFVAKYNANGVNKVVYPMQPLRDIHFSTDHGGVSKGLILSLFMIGIFLIVTACINFVNLATAQALTRSREVGVRKVMGSTQGQLFAQFMGETTLITLVATALALVLFQWGQQLQHQLNGAFTFTFYFDASVIGWVVLLVLGVILLSGVYPALVLARFRPVMALAGKITTRQVGGFSVRRGLVITQFSISQVLIISMVVVASQLRFVQDKALGFRKNAILTIQLPAAAEQNLTKMRTFRNLATRLPDVEAFSYSYSGAPQSDQISRTFIQYDTRSEEEKFNPDQKFIDADYLDLYGLKLVAGRNLYPSDTAREALVNETLVKRLGIRNPAQVLGKTLRKGSQTMEIVGVVNDFNQATLESAIDPLFMTTVAANYQYANLQLHTGNFQRVISQLEKQYNAVYPDSYFSHQFVDDQIERSYQQEQTMGKLVNFFAGVAVMIGCLGLYGLVLFMATQKTKEIGVRKVLGASVGSILWLFGREFARLIAVAFVLAAPLAWWVMNRWLQDFAYRINLSPGIFAIAIGATVFVAALTVSFQSVRAALTNPVKSLRSD